ncbi:MAG: PilN domain-containing protein [Smithella sp.]
MIKINLLPYREKEKKDNVTRQISIMAGSLVVFVLVLIFIQFKLNSMILSLEGQIKESEAKLVDLNKKIGQVDEFKKVKKELEQKLGVIKSLEENRLVPVKMFDDLAVLVPRKNMWLVKIAQKNDQLIIEGIGKDNLIVADFMKTIEKFEPIKSVDLVSSKKMEIGDITFQQFNFSCILKKGF